MLVPPLVRNLSFRTCGPPMALAVASLPSEIPFPSFSPRFHLPKSLSIQRRETLRLSREPQIRVVLPRSLRVRSSSDDESNQDSKRKPLRDEEVNDLGVKAALSILKFYKREISPLMLSSCRYVPTCSEYSMEAYKKYGVLKGTVLTAWRLCRCNPLGGYGFDPPRWFDEEKPSDQ